MEGWQNSSWDSVVPRRAMKHTGNLFDPRLKEADVYLLFRMNPQCLRFSFWDDALGFIRQSVAPVCDLMDDIIIILISSGVLTSEEELNPVWEAFKSRKCIALIHLPKAICHTVYTGSSFFSPLDKMVTGISIVWAQIQVYWILVSRPKPYWSNQSPSFCILIVV